MPKPAVSPKNTKQEILEAYEQLQSQLSPAPTPTGKTSKIPPASAINQVISTLQNLIPELEKEQLAQQKELDKAQEKLGFFYRDLARREEELRYSLKKNELEQSDSLATELKTKRAEFDAELTKKLADLDARTLKLQEAENELKSLRDEAKVAPARFAMELKKAVENARAEEQAAAAHAKALADASHTGELALREQKISILEKLTAEQAKEITSLKSAYEHAAEQMKSMAVSAISASRPLPAPPVINKE